jgi:tRNA threonylcarbamoyladenosine biosynthesis protein TsaE
MQPRTVIKGLGEVKLFAQHLLTYLSQNQKTTQVISLTGNLGAGKTTLVQQLARELGIQETVTSPTFTIMKSYAVPQPHHFERLVHMDAYRIEDLEELRPLGLEGFLTTPGNLICIEWAERIASVLPQDTIYLTLKTIDEETREVIFETQKQISE